MQIIITETAEKELQSVSRYFSEEQLIKAAQKAYDGLGVDITTSMKKVYLTSKSVAGRALFLVKKEKEVAVLILIRIKNDKVGKNMSYKNSEFTKALNKNLPHILKEISEKKYRILS